MAIAANTGAACHQCFDWPISTITVEIAPGPASIGMPRGVTPISSFCWPSSLSSIDSCVPDRLASSI